MDTTPRLRWQIARPAALSTFALGLFLVSACVVGCSGDGDPRDAHAVSNNWRAFSVPSGAMIPTVIPGDRVLVSNAAYRTEAPRRGDVVVLRVPDLIDEHAVMTIIKRIVAEGGDRVRIDAGAVYINGSPEVVEEIPCTEEACAGLTLQRVRGESGSFEVAHSIGAEMQSYPEIVVEPDHYYLLGDYRDKSYDSRQWGTVPRKDILGQVWRIYFSIDPKTGWVRLSRLGHLIR